LFKISSGICEWKNITLKDIGPSTRSLGAAQIFGSKIFFFGGGDNNTKNNCLTIYNISNFKK